MLITNEMVKEYADKPAVFAVKVAAGTEIAAEHLEHPMFLDDMVSSNLFTLDEALTIGQVIGVKAAKDCDALTPVTEEAVGGTVTCSESYTVGRKRAGSTDGDFRTGRGYNYYFY